MQWLDTDDGHEPADLDAGSDADLPGAAQLEFVRRLGERRSSTGREVDFRALADIALQRSAAGRGLGHLTLIRPGHSVAGIIGAPPVDPAQLPVRELLRVGAGTLAELLLRQDHSAGPVRRLRRRTWSRQFHLAGAPTTVADVRVALVGTGHAEGGRRPEVLVFAAPFDQLMSQVWSARVQRGAPVRWPTFMGTWAAKDILPPSADLPRIAEHWAGIVGSARVHIVVETDGGAARRTASAILGLRTVEPVGRPDVGTLSPAGVEVVRLVNGVLNVRVAADVSRDLVRRLAGLMHDDGARMAVPPGQRDWADARAREIAERLSAGGYAVHGDLGQIVLGTAGATREVARRDVLDLVLETCLRVADQR